MKTNLESIYESIEKFLIPLTIEETYEKIVKELMRLTGAYCGAVNLYKDKTWKIVYSNIPNLPYVVTRKKGFSYKAIQSGKPLVFRRNEIIDVHPYLAYLKFKWNAFLPLSHDKKTLGVVILLHKQNKIISKKTLDILKIFGSLSTLALLKTELYKDIKDTLDERELFISLAAHELRTPLTTINAYVQLVSHQIQKEQTINPQWITQLLLSTDRLKRLIFELLQIEEIKKGKLSYKMAQINLKEIIKQALTDFKFFHPKKKILFADKLNYSNNIIGDMDKLLQVFNNVLNNAAKFSKDGSEINVSLDYETPHYIVTISDQGEGMSEKDLSRVFDKYYKGKQKNREGLGLGLYLVKKIIEKHKGNVIIESSKNKGTTVKIMLLKHH